jgi:hypothetical protein
MGATRRRREETSHGDETDHQEGTGPHGGITALLGRGHDRDRVACGGSPTRGLGRVAPTQGRTRGGAGARKRETVPVASLRRTGDGGEEGIAEVPGPTVDPLVELGFRSFTLLHRSLDARNQPALDEADIGRSTG